MGRKKEHRQKLTCYVKPQTRKAIRRSIVRGDKTRNTSGKVVDDWGRGK